uniref:methionine--tRNA ligase n=1 Tax=Aegilops tauschii TaxID=37682 RepID=M8BN61_AEGTA
MSSGKGKAKVPVAGRRNVLVTSALPYVNNVPHLGNIIGCVLSADVFARYCRLRGHNVLYVCGTDEYGTATENKALEEGCSPLEICDKYHAIHKEVYEWFNISFDHFGRTSTPQQTEICQSIFSKLLDNNWLSENTMQQVCEGIPIVRDTDHLFLELPLLKEQLEKYIDEASATGSWSQNAVRITDAWLKEGLRPRCITRDLKWGVPVPHEKYKDKVFYVWFDAPIGYISITACYTPEWEKWWKNPENVELYQFMGKDNVPFHTVMFPSALLGTGENWTLMKNISVTEYLNYESGKFSKTKGLESFGNDAKATNIPADASDAVFTWGGLQIKHNNELLKNLGNFIYRVLSFIAKPEGAGYGSIIPEAPNADIHPLSQSLAETVGNLIQQYIDAMDKVKLKQGLKIAMAISSEGNAYLQVLQQLNLSPNEHISFADEKGESDKAKRPWDLIPSNHRIGEIVPLFTELKMYIN